ncbi:osmotically inducible protein C, partial [Pseudomonas fluorescens]
ANTTFSSNVADIVAAATHLTQRGMAPSLLIGHSLGGAAVLRATGQIEGIKAVATLNAPFDPAHVLRALEADIHVIETEGCAQVQLGHGKFPITQNFLADVAQSKLTNAIGHLDAALLVLHGPRDEIVGIDNAT